MQCLSVGSSGTKAEIPVSSALLVPVVAGGMVATCAFGCAVRLFFRLRRADRLRLPIAAIVLIGVTTLITGLQFFFPDILSAFRRDGEALRTGQWWRLMTPLFVQADGWVQCVVNGITALVFCPLGEMLYGKRMLALYFISGLVGEIVGYIQNSHGAGSSLGICGVIGGVFTFACIHRSENPRSTVVLAIVGFYGAVILSVWGDLHGFPILTGALLGSMMRSQMPITPRSDM
jgi:rhomboid protease GluP